MFSVASVCLFVVMSCLVGDLRSRSECSCLHFAHSHRTPVVPNYPVPSSCINELRERE